MMITMNTIHNKIDAHSISVGDNFNEFHLFLVCLFVCLFMILSGYTQYISEPDRMLAKYFFCSLGIFIGIMFMRILVYPL